MGQKGTEIVETDVKEIIEDLNRAYADEWLAVYAYTYMAEVVEGRPAAKNLEAELKKLAAEELEHQEELAGRITQLGGTPIGDPTKLVESSNEGYPAPPKDPKDIDGVIRTVIEAERGAIAVYNKLLKKTAGVDPVTYNLILHILEEEIDHEDDFESIQS
ncbi:MAG: ferritin-like domain-containing protein [Spirochaetaceae bacterium]